MIVVRRSAARGKTDIGWLDSRHTFSFGEYHDPGAMGFRSLRVINEDRVAPGQGFGAHSHRDMEILSYVLEGELGHKDDMGNGSVIRPGDLQRMTAGTGVVHSEANPSKANLVHFLQIWILPEKARLAPGYEQKSFPESTKSGTLKLVGSRDGRDGTVTIHQDIALYSSVLAPGEKVELPLAANRHAWIQVTRGSVVANDQTLLTGDGAAVSDEANVTLVAKEKSELLLFDLA